ncbi:MAG: imidazolonepropionase [Candidatus Latescibacteria bacterium]|nr:imidazolonepropionase [bacterium]MBD3425385.1 imidazolonepropionase [Candidatus Latescibacterota bacterium]
MLFVSICKGWRLAETVDLLLLGAGQLITCRAEKPLRGKQLADPGIITGGALAVRDGRIIAIGNSAELEKKFRDSSVSDIIDVEGRVVMPGWVDPHTHAVFPGYRADEYEARIRGDSYLEIEKRGGGIKRTVKDLRKIDEDRLYELSRRRLLKMIRSGVTSLEIKSGYGLDIENELKMLRVISRLSDQLPVDIVSTFMGAHQKPEENPEGYVKLVVEEMIPEVAETGLARYMDIFCEKGVFDLEETRRIMEAGKANGFGLKAHTDEIYAIGGTELAVELGAVSVEHLTRITPGGIKALSGSETIGILLPATSFGLASSHFAPARKLVDSGAAIALATDFNPGSNPSSSMPLAVSIACSQMGLVPAEAINAATVNAAWSIGLGTETGSLMVGKKGDFVVYDIEDYREIPARAGLDHSVMVAKEGRMIWERKGFRRESEVGV